MKKILNFIATAFLKLLGVIGTILLRIIYAFVLFIIVIVGFFALTFGGVNYLGRYLDRIAKVFVKSKH